MSAPYMPLYTGDYLRDTRHLSCAEHGIYALLLFFCWDQQGMAPLDERKLMGIVNARSTDEIAAMRRVLAEFFIESEAGWESRRVQRELRKSKAISAKRAVAGRLGGKAKLAVVR